MMATIKPTKPLSPKDETNEVMFATTSPITIVLPNNSCAIIPNPSNDTKMVVKPAIKSPALFNILFIKTSYDFVYELDSITKYRGYVNLFLIKKKPP